MLEKRSFAFPQAMLQRMAAERVTGFAMVPTIAAILLAARPLEATTCRSLRYLTNAGAGDPHRVPGPPARRGCPHVQLFPMYGQTECIRISYLPPDQVDVRPGSVGKGMANQELTLVDERGSPSHLARSASWWCAAPT